MGTQTKKWHVLHVLQATECVWTSCHSYLLDPDEDIIFFFLLIDMYCFLYTFFGIKLGRVYFSTEAWSGTWVFFTAREKKLLLVGSPDNCSLTALLVMMVCVEGRGRTLLQWWQYQVQLFCILLSKDLISDREKHPVSLICFDWQWSPIL